MGPGLEPIPSYLLTLNYILDSGMALPLGRALFLFSRNQQGELS